MKNKRRYLIILGSKEFGDILSKHFAEVTPEQFVENLKKYCPEVFEGDIENSERSPTETNESNNDLAEETAKA